jgi:YesN/AraC family two-component response regulator
MNGRFANLDEFNEKGKEIDILFTRQFFFAGIFNIKNLIGNERAEVVKEIEAYFLPEIEGYGKDSMDESSIIFVFSSDEIDYSHLEDKFMQLRTHLFNNWNIEATIGIGNLYRLPGEIGKSYIEASTAMDYRLIKGKNRVIMFNEIFQYQKNMNHYSNERLEQLEFCLLQGNVEKVDEILDGIVAYIDNDNISLFMVRSICFDIINTVIKAVSRFKKEYSNEISYPDVITLTRFDTINELVEIVQQISNDICIRVKEQKNQRRNQIEQIMKYINLNYDKYSFSIQNMSDHFQVSLSNMSHYFKDQAGENISDYVNNLRMKKAKKLLVETDECLQDIVDKIGYTNVSSFIRKFKQATSITPGEFREISKNNLKERQ